MQVVGFVFSGVCSLPFLIRKPNRALTSHLQLLQEAWIQSDAASGGPAAWQRTALWASGELGVDHTAASGATATKPTPT